MAKARDSLNWLMVVAIDFGTTYTGYGFSFKDRPKKIFMSKDWGYHQGGRAGVKTTTSVLVDEDGNFVAFGHQAEQKYSDNLQGSDDSDDEEAAVKKEDKRLYLFRHFKMHLQSIKSLNDDIEVLSIDKKKTMSLFQLIVMTLEYMKDSFEHQLNKQGGGVKPEEIRWVITVPAIWPNVAKRFMKKAAVQAGLVKSLNSKQLLVALEPEVAALYCRTRDNEDGDSVILPDNTRYMVVDAGGGTLDIAVHETLPDDQAREVYYPTGGDWGGNQVNACFQTLLEEVLGEDFVRYFKEECPMHWLNLMDVFEGKKRTLKRGSHLRFDIPYQLSSSYRDFKTEDIEQVFKRLQLSGNEDIALKSGHMSFSSDVVNKLFSTSVPATVNHLRQLLQEQEQPCTHVMMVGGFSDSPYIQDEVKESLFADDRYKLILPHYAASAVVQGAVLFGHNPCSISSRYARMTYGIMSSDEYNPDIHHDKNKIYEVGGVKRSCGIFHTIVKKGTEVFDDKPQKKSMTPVNPDDKSLSVRIFATDKTEVTYTDEPGVREIEQFDVPIGKREEEDKMNPVKLRFYFGSTEIRVIAQGKRASTIQRGYSDQQ